MLRALLSIVAGVHQVVGAIVGPLLDFVDRRGVVRRAMVLIVLWQLVDAYVWAKAFAGRDGMTGAELSLVIAAITLPVTALQGFLFRMYDQSRRSPEPGSVGTPAPSVGER